MSELTKSPDDALHPALEPPPVNHEEAAPSRVDKVVFGVAAVVAIAFVLWGALGTESLSTSATAGLDFVVHNTGWLFSLVASGFVVFVIWLAASKYGNIPLGGDGEAPEFRTSSWVAMMFSAGMGIGLMFYGVTEPLTHLVTPPPGTGAKGNPEAVQTAMATTMFHWSLHPWAIYAVVGLAVAYGVFRKGRSLLISSAFAPLFGEKRANGPAGRVIDIFAIFATLFGSATSLGLGALQIGSGLEIVGGIGKVGNGVLIGIIVVLTVCFILSAVSGIEKGIQWLSNINMVLALALAFFVFVVGPTVFILNLVPTTIGLLLQGPRDDVGAHRRRRRRRHEGLARRLDDLLLGLVGQLDPVRRHVHRPHLAWPHDPPVRLGRAARAVGRLAHLVRHLRWRRHLAAAGRHRTSPASRRRRARSSRCSATCPGRR